MVDRLGARWQRRLAEVTVVLTLGLGGCIADEDPEVFRGLEEGVPPPVQQVPAPLGAAHCEIMVDGIGTLEMETDYLPHVITCENGGANLEALKAQAIAARSVAYYAIETAGSICDSQGCQVYSCAATPSPQAYQAVEETAGMYLMYNSTLTYGFYVAGDSSVGPPSCIGSSGSTEQWVTYNEGLSGTDVQQTDLGFVHQPGDAGYGQNRGCMSQWSARCLENSNGYDYVGILRFFYGDDIEIPQATGACVMAVGDTGAPGDSSGGGGLTSGPGLTSGGGTFDGGGSEGGALTSGGSNSAGGSGAVDGGADGMGEDGAAVADTEEALPDTFGGIAGDGGACACRAGRRDGGATAAWLGLVAMFAFGRGRRRRA